METLIPASQPFQMIQKVSRQVEAQARSPQQLYLSHPETCRKVYLHIKAVTLSIAPWIESLSINKANYRDPS
jgi:hypothetical protein